MNDKSGKPWPIRVVIPVAWGDMDAFSHVNNVVYLRWFETARIAFFEAAQMLERMQTEQVGPILARMSCEYLLPLTYPDNVAVRTRCTRIGGSSFDMAYQVTSQRTGKISATGDAVIVMLNYRTGASVKIEGRLRELLVELS